MDGQDRQREQALGAWLVSEARGGEPGALDRLARLYGPRLLAHAVRLMGETEAGRDVAQEAWAEILAALPALREPRAFAGFAYRIVSRRAARTIRGRQQGRALAREAALVAEAEAELPWSDPGAAASDAERVRAALAALPAAQRATVALFYLEDFTVAEVAAALDVPPGTVKTRLMHAREKLRALLEPAAEGERQDEQA